MAAQPIVGAILLFQFLILRRVFLKFHRLVLLRGFLTLWPFFQVLTPRLKEVIALFRHFLFPGTYLRWYHKEYYDIDGVYTCFCPFCGFEIGTFEWNNWLNKAIDQPLFREVFCYPHFFVELTGILGRSDVTVSSAEDRPAQFFTH